MRRAAVIVDASALVSYASMGMATAELLMMVAEEQRTVAIPAHAYLVAHAELAVDGQFLLTDLVRGADRVVELLPLGVGDVVDSAVIDAELRIPGLGQAIIVARRYNVTLATHHAAVAAKLLGGHQVLDLDYEGL